MSWLNVNMIKLSTIGAFTCFFPYCLTITSYSYLEQKFTKGKNLPMEATTIKAMTWTTLQLVKTWDGNNYYALVGSDQNSDPYVGDTLITESLPILCIKKDNLPKPDFVVSHLTGGGAARATWSGGYIGLTSPVQGITLTSRDIANSICRETFGEGFRMAEFHDGEGPSAAWDFWGKLLNPNLTLTDRFWVAISDQAANPWSHLL